MDLQLKGERAAVSGAGRDIGKAIHGCERFRHGPRAIRFQLPDVARRSGPAGEDCGT